MLSAPIRERHRHELQSFRRRPGRHHRPAPAGLSDRPFGYRAAAHRREQAQGPGRACALPQCRRRGLPLPARCRLPGSGQPGDQSEHLHHRRQHRLPHRQRLDLRPARTRPRTTRGAARQQAHRQPGLPRQRLHPAGSPAGGRRPAGPGNPAVGLFPDRLQRRRQADDRRLRSRRRCTPAEPASLCHGPGPQAPAGNACAERLGRRAGVQPHRRSLPQGSGSHYPPARQPVASRYHGGRPAGGAGPSL